jgi:hypothetical protein
MYKYFVYVNPYVKRVRVHSFDCSKCRNLDISLKEQTVSKNGIWYGFNDLDSASNFAMSQGISDVQLDGFLKG